MRTSSGGEGGNCIAVVAGTHLAEENVPPMAALGSGDGEFERGFASGVTEDRRAGKQAPAQGGQFRTLGLTEPALQADAYLKHKLPWIALVATIAAIMVSPVIPSKFQESKLLLGLIGGIWALTFYLHTRHAEDAKFFRDLFLAFNARYDVLNDDLGIALISEGEFSASAKRKFIDYFNLCAEEWLFSEWVTSLAMFGTLGSMAWPNMGVTHASWLCG